MGTNGFFTRIASGCRHDGGHHRLAEWWSERRSRNRWGSIVLADGFGMIEGPGGQRSFLLEFDRGTESPARVALKLDAYERVALVDERPDAVLFCLPESRPRGCGPEGPVSARHDARHRKLGPGVAEDPLGPVWLLIGEQRRRTLLDLPIAAPAPTDLSDISTRGERR